MTTYQVKTTIVDGGESTAEFRTLSNALDCAFIFFSGVDFVNRYTNAKYLENALKQRNCPSAGISGNMKTWHIEISKLREMDHETPAI